MPKIHVTISKDSQLRLSVLSGKYNCSTQELVERGIQILSSDPSRNLVNSKPPFLNNEKYKFTFIDLFAGIGGIRLALHMNGGKCVFSSEYDRWCQKTYFENFGELPEGDINKIDLNSIPSHDILAAGFPCQPFSIAGVSKKKSLGREHGFKDKTQGTLFFKIAEIIDLRRPKIVVLENVKNLRNHDKGKTFRIIQETLQELDYECFYEIIDAKTYVPQHRERVFIVAFDRKIFTELINFNFPTPRKPKKILGSILEKNVSKKYVLSDKLWNYLIEYAEKHKRKGNGFGYGLFDKKSVTRTLSARYYKDGSEILLKRRNSNPRRLTPRECARLMGYPDSFIIPVSDTQAYKQFGNSVVVPLVSDLIKAILNVISQNQLSKH